MLVVLNTDPKTAMRANIDLAQCGPVKSERVFTATGEIPTLTETPPGAGVPGAVVQVLPPSSFSVVDVTLDKKGR